MIEETCEMWKGEPSVVLSARIGDLRLLGRYMPKHPGAAEKRSTFTKWVEEVAGGGPGWGSGLPWAPGDHWINRITVDEGVATCVWRPYPNHSKPIDAFEVHSV